MIRSSDPTFSARWTLWIPSNSSATWPSFSDRTDRVTSDSLARSAALPASAACSSSFCTATTRGSFRVRASTSRAKTTAAAGAPPMTDA